MLQINVVPDKSAVVVVHPTPGVGDATTIADALRMIPSGGDVHVRDGTYTISAGLTIPSNVKLVGAGRGKTILNMTGAFTLFTTTGGYFCLSEVTVQGDNTSAQIVLNTNHDVDIACSDFNQIKGVVTAVSSAADVSMRDCNILLSALAGTGIYLWKGATAGTLQWDYVHMSVPITNATLVEGPTGGSAGCNWKVVQSYTGAPPPVAANFYYLQTVDWVNFKVDVAKITIYGQNSKLVGCDFNTCFVRFNTTTISNAIITGCNFELGGNDFGIWIAQLIFVAGASDAVVSGCVFRGNSVSFVGIYVENCQDIVITGCEFRGHTGWGIENSGGLPACKVVVTGCAFSETLFSVLEGSTSISRYNANIGFTRHTLSDHSVVDSENFRNVRTFGATGDGVTDDLSDIQTAFNLLPNVGATVFFPPGHYKISDTILLQGKPIKIQGSGDGTIIDCSSGSFAAFTADAHSALTHISISDLQILGGGGGGGFAPVGGPVVGATLNDTFASAPSVTGANGTFAAGSNAGFTGEGGEPLILGNAVAKSGWLEWTAPASGTATIDLSGSAFDTLLAVYTGVSVGALTLVVADDDSGAGLTSLVTFPAVMGTSYKFKVDGFGGASGSVTVTMSLVAALPGGDNNIINMNDPNGNVVVSMERVNAYAVSKPIKVSAGLTSRPTVINMTDCYIQQLADSSSILIVNSPLYRPVNLIMDKVRFYRDFEDAVVGSIAEGGFYANFTNVNIVAKDSYLAHGGVDCTIGALNLENCTVANYGVGTNKRICVADDNFSAIRSSVVGCNLSFVDFDLAGNGTYFSNCYMDTCGFKDGAISFFASCYFTDGGVNPTDTVIDSLGDTIVTGCYFNANAKSYSIKRAVLVEGCTFVGNSTVTVAYIFLSSVAKATVSNCNFRPLQAGTIGPAVAGIHLSSATECIVSNNRFDKVGGIIVWEVPPILEAGTANLNVYSGNKGMGGGTGGTPSTFIGAKSVVEGENVQTVSATTTLDETHRTVRVDASGASRTMNLPSAASARYRKHTVKKIDSSANAVVVDPNGAELIDGVATFSLTVLNQSVTFISNGTSWDIV
jgi:hypothetical protein